MSDNWVVQNLQNALDTWNSKLSEIWQLLTTSPQEFKGGSIWNVMVTINGAVQAIGLALLVLFFVVGVVRTCGSFTEVKKPEHALKLFIRGERPVMDFKYDILKHPNVVLTTDGKASAYKHGEVTVKHSSISVLSLDPKELPEENYGETTYELLSDEDFEVNKNIY